MARFAIRRPVPAQTHIARLSARKLATYCLCGVWLAAAAGGTRALAQEAPAAAATGSADAAHRADSWLVFPSTIGRSGDTVDAPRAVATALVKRLPAQKTMSGKLAQSYFEKRGSSTPVPVSHSDLEALSQDAQLALYHVASGLLSQARHDVARALVRADRALESLNRESISAQQLLDACLFMVRAHLMAHEHAQALEQALECRRRVPELDPDPKMHPPEVIGLVAEAEAELRLRNPGALRVESEPDGCTVYVNGRPLGRAPLELPQLSPGEYRLQAECTEGEVGRVHRVTVSNGRVVKHIDTRFDAAVVTALEPSLRYTNPADQRAYGEPDAVEIGRIVGVDTVLWTHPALDAQIQPRPGIVEVTRLRVRDGAQQARVLVHAGDDKSLAATIAALEASRSADFTGSPVPKSREDSAPAAALPSPAPVATTTSISTATAAAEAESAPASAAASSKAASSDAHAPVLAPILVTAGGGALLIGAAITGVLAANKHAEIARKCPNSQCDYPGFDQDQQTGTTLSTLTTTLLIAGTATAAAGAIWWLLAANTKDQTHPPVTASCLPGLCHLSIEGRF
jgi:tetratricopeptide (TPR) repeat protein